MATTGKIVNDFRTGYSVQVDWVVNSQNIGNNTSNITAKVQLVSKGSAYVINSTSSKNGTLAINGTSYSFTFTAGVKGSQTKTLFTKTVDVAHSGDGSKVCPISANINLGVTLSGVHWGNIPVSGKASLNTIPRTSSFTLTQSNCTLGSTTQTVNINRASSSFTHKITYKFGSINTVLQAQSSGVTSFAFKRELSDASQIPNSTTGTATIVVDTYNGNQLIGSASKTFTITVPATVKPSVWSFNVSGVSSGADFQTYGYVKGKSKAKLEIAGASGAGGSSIKGYSITGGGFSSSTSSFTTGVINAVGNITFTAKVTDSRGRVSDPATVTINVKDYSNPKISQFIVTRCLADGTIDSEGVFIKATATYSYSAITGNSLTNNVKYRKSGTTAWTTSGSIANGKSVVIGNGSIDTASTYEVSFTVSDKFTSVANNQIVGTSFVTMDIKKGGKGVAIGKMAEFDDALDLNVKTIIRKGVHAVSPLGSTTREIVKIYEADVNGLGIAIQGGGMTVIGGGESAQAYMDSLIDKGNENCAITADGTVELISGVQKGINNVRVCTWSDTGLFTINTKSIEINSGLKIAGSSGMSAGIWAGSGGVVLQSFGSSKLHIGKNNSTDMIFEDSKIDISKAIVSSQNITSRNIALRGNDIYINEKRALVSLPTDNILRINYDKDYSQGVKIYGSTEIGQLVLTEPPATNGGMLLKIPTSGDGNAQGDGFTNIGYKGSDGFYHHHFRGKGKMNINTLQGAYITKELQTPVVKTDKGTYTLASHAANTRDAAPNHEDIAQFIKYNDLNNIGLYRNDSVVEKYLTTVDSDDRTFIIENNVTNSIWIALQQALRKIEDLELMIR